MDTDITTGPAYLTTREVADLLRVRERKVYDLAAAGEIPHRRITGKLLFPRDELMDWIDGTGAAATSDRPAVVAGSHDPLLDWAIRESRCGLATLFDGSMDGVARFARHEAALSGLHVPEAAGGNGAAVARAGLRDAVLVGWARRHQGILTAPGSAAGLTGLRDLKGLRVALRQPGAGSRALFDHLAEQAGLEPGHWIEAGPPARTESDAAASVAAGTAQATLGLRAMAAMYRLDFVPLAVEDFDLLMDRRSYFTGPVQRLMTFSRSDIFMAKAAEMGGYDLSEAHAVRWLAP